MPHSFHAYGQHIILDLYGVEAIHLSNPDTIQAVMLTAAKTLKATVLQSHLHHFGQSMGVTGVLLLAESHMSIHTWPEKGFAAIDIFMCGDIDMSPAIEQFIHELQPKNHNLRALQRGMA